MADDDDRQPPQSYDTVAPAGVGAASSNQVSPGTMQEILETGEQNLIDQAFDQMEQAGDYDALTRYLESLPDLGPPVQASSPAGVGSPGSQSYRSIHTTPPSSPDTPLTWGSATLTPTPRTARGGRTAAGAGVMVGDAVVLGLEVVDVVVVGVVVVVVLLGVLVLVLVVLAVVVVVEEVEVLVVLVVEEVVVVVEVEVVVVAVVVEVVDDADDDDDDFSPLHL